MTHTHRFVHALVAALAVTALAVPAALATPLQEPSSGDGGHVSTQAATHPRHRGTTARDQDLRHLRAGAAVAGAPLPGPPTWPAHPQPITPAREAVSHYSASVDWTLIALGIAGGCLVVGGAAGIATRTRRRAARTRVAA